MARFIVPLDQLPVPDVQGNHRVRFRVTTEDQNSVSEWSTIFKVQSVGQTASQNFRFSFVEDNFAIPKIIRLVWSIDD
jgi:hypothetical protein